HSDEGLSGAPDRDASGHAASGSGEVGGIPKAKLGTLWRGSGGGVMAIPTISNVPEDVHRALRTQAEQHGRSTEAEVREILAVAFKPENRVLVGDAQAAIGRKSGLTDEDFAILESVRD